MIVLLLRYGYMDVGVAGVCYIYMSNAELWACIPVYVIMCSLPVKLHC